MSNIFICYGDKNFKVSLDRIARQARRTGRFDKIVKYTPKDLPTYVRSSLLFAESKGGGCWCWKPYIISDALSNCKIGDVIYYADAGCTLVADSPEWDQFDSLLKTDSAIYFQYRRDFSYKGWDKYGRDGDVDKTAIKHWMKPALIDYFKKYSRPEMFNFDSLMAGFIIIKKVQETSLIINLWLEIMLQRPDLVLPPSDDELLNYPDSFYAHRYDQSILTPLVYLYADKDNALILPETSESQIGNPAVVATRWRQAALKPISYLKYRLSELIHHQ